MELGHDFEGHELQRARQGQRKRGISKGVCVTLIPAASPPLACASASCKDEVLEHARREQESGHRP